MPGLLRGLARTALISGTATAVSNRVSRRQAGRWAQRDQQVFQDNQPQQVEPPQPRSSSMDDSLAQLKQLAELRAQGVLTDAEFEQLWLELMIAHHEGAVEMAEEQLAEGTYRPAVELAEDVVAAQTAEIDQMRELLG